MQLDRPNRSSRLEALAAEYALGTLPARARRRLGATARSNPVVARVIAEWEARLASLAEALPGITPPPRVWDGVVARLGLKLPAGAADVGPAPWWASLAFGACSRWRASPWLSPAA